MSAGLGGFAQCEVRKPAGGDPVYSPWAQLSKGYKGAQSVLEMTLFLDSTSVALVQDFAPVALGQDLTDTAYYEKEY